ncbi:MAG: hypothetical protein ACNS60_15900 [Candidatus Cyclobacteriaceae bacterium M2_1C_046]
MLIFFKSISEIFDPILFFNKKKVTAAGNQMIEAIKGIKDFFEPHIRIELSELLPLRNYLRIESFPKKSVIKHAGEKEYDLRFILKGGGVKLIQKPEGEICFEICFEKEFFFDFESYNSTRATNVCLKNFEPMTVATISRAQLISIYEKSPLGVQLGRILAEEISLKTHHHRLDLVGSTDEGYNRMMERQPEIMLRVPMQYVASYLNITQQTLSRIRKMKGHWGK